MTEQNPHEKSLEELQQEFGKARSDRNNARDKLRDALDAHGEIKRISEHLREKKARLEGERANIRSVLRSLDERISKAEKRLAGIAEAGERLQVEGEVRELGLQRERNRAELKENDTLRKQVDGKVKEAAGELREAADKVGSARTHLGETRGKVPAAGSEVIRKAASLPLKGIKGMGARIFDKLGLSGALSVAYIFAVIIGLGGDLIYYAGNGVDIFHYARPEDFFLSGYKLLIIPVSVIVVLWLVLTAVKLVLQALAVYGFPVFTEKAALLFPGLITWLATPMTLAFTIVLIVPVAAYASAFTQQWQQSPKDGISVVLEDPFEYAHKLAWIGSNSRYAFFCADPGRCGDDQKDILIIPLDRIVCINESGNENVNNCRKPKASMEIEFKQNEEIRDMLDRLIGTLESHNRILPVTENELYSYVEGTMNCAAGRLVVSDFILFENDRSELREQAAGKVDDFLKRSKNPPDFMVFGFASPDGHRGENEELAGERACKVAHEVCAKVDQDHGYFEYAAKSDDNCGCRRVRINTDVGEDHFINGVANSRSAVIAACDDTPSDQV